MSWLKRLLGVKNSESVVEVAKSKDGERCLPHERKSISLGICPDCGKEGWIAGPCGGAAQNWACDNPLCGSRFNIAELMGLFICERISDPSPLAKKEVVA